MTRLRVLILCAAAAVLFAASFLLWGQGATFVSPDENAYYFFARTYAETGRLFTVELLNTQLGDVLAPRSILALGGRLVPGGFAGLPFLYGGLARTFGMWILPFITPLLAAAAVIGWAAVTRKLFGGRIGWWSGMLLALHPAWWLYSARGFMPNVPFTAFLIACAFFLLIRPVAWMQDRYKKRVLDWVDPVLAGLALGAALLIRMVEAPWVLLALAGVAVWKRQKLTRMMVLPFICALLFALAPFPFLNRELYGGWFSTGYTAGTAQSLPEEWKGLEAERVATQTLAPWRATLNAVVAPVFPFGIHPRRMLVEISQYGVQLFWWMSALSVVGLVLFLRKTPSNSLLQRGSDADVRRAYLIVTAFVAVWLGILYGSWGFSDNPDPAKITIGNSHVRYWLPVFVLLTPLAAMAIEAGITEVSSLLSPSSQRGGRVAATALFVVILAALSVHGAYFAAWDGIQANREALAQFAVARERVLDLTESDAVLIADRADKFLFPARSVRYPLRDEKTYALIPRMLSVAPVYYFGLTLPPEDLAYLNDVKLPPYGARLDVVETINHETLYRVRAW